MVRGDLPPSWHRLTLTGLVFSLFSAGPLELTLLPHANPLQPLVLPETKAVISAYERCLATSDMGGLAALRSTIEVRTSSEREEGL